MICCSQARGRLHEVVEPRSYLYNLYLINESGAAKAKVVGRADDNRGDRRGTETENGRDSDVAENEEPRHTTEAMHRKEGPNIKLNNNKRPRCTDKK